ncbi:MAG: diaminopimelate decarboxylase [Janthinobacterium lividum]
MPSRTQDVEIQNPRPFQYRNGQLCCEGIPLARLAREHGTPLYIYSETHLLERLRLFQEAFHTVPHTVCFAVKSNSSLALLKLLAGHGAGFDIVSGGELARVVRAAKGAVGRTVFSGVGKTVAELDAALAAEILIFNVESEAELAVLAARAKKLKQKARFALRVNPDVFAETHPYISTGLSAHKFGIDIRQARRIYRKALHYESLVPAGVSVHIGSQIRAVDPFGAALDRVTTLVKQLRRDGIALTHIDAGGGLGIEYTDTAFDPAAAVKAYADQVLAATADLGLHLLLEPGRFLIAQAGALVTEVVVTKRNGNKDFVITDAGMNDLIRPALYQAHHGIWPVRQASGGERASKVDVVGPVCESGDFFARDRKLAPVEAGDLLAIVDAGAYGMTQASNYNTRPRAAEVLVAGKSSRLIRRRETFRDMVSQELG